MSFNALLLLVFLQFGRPQEFFPFLNPYRLALLFTVITLLLTFFNKEHFTLTDCFKIKESKLYLIFFFIMVLGIPFAYHRGNAFDFVLLKYLANVIFFFLFVVNVQSKERLKKVLFVVSIAVLFLATMSLMHGGVHGGRFFPGTMYDPNDLAYFLVSFLPIFFVFLRKYEPLVNKIMSTTGILLSIAVVLLSGSRGGLLGLGVVLFFILFSKIVVERTAVKVFLSFSAVVIISMHADQINVERFQSITALSSDYNLTSESGRLAIWKRGFRLVISNPVTGVGVACFGKAIGEQRDAEGEIPRWQVAHNSFVQVAVETGLIGFVVFSALLFASLKNFRRLSKHKRTEELLTEYANIPGICLVGLCGTMMGAFFLTQGYSLIFTFYFAVSAVLRNLFE